MSKFKDSRSKKTVLITGGAGGIGREFARLFASDGCHVVLVDLVEESLEKLQLELSREYPAAHCSMWAMDLSELGAAERLYQWCDDKSLVVDTLVNNVGFGMFGDHVDLESKRAESMLLLNNMLLTQLCQYFGSEMKQRGEGEILNVASMAGMAPMPMFAAYSASKAYVISFSASLARELEPYKVYVSCLCPSTTKTGFLDAAQTKSETSKGITKFVSKSISTPEQVALAGYEGLKKRKLVFLPSLSLSIQGTMIGMLPRKVATWWVKRQSEN